jgi:hypothetical protein
VSGHSDVEHLGRTALVWTVVPGSDDLAVGLDGETGHRLFAAAGLSADDPSPPNVSSRRPRAEACKAASEDVVVAADDDPAVRLDRHGEWEDRALDAPDEPVAAERVVRGSVGRCRATRSPYVL